MRSVPIPGEILRTTMFLGLTFDELITLGAVPLVVVFPTLFIEQIPLIASLSTILVSVLGVAAIIIRTPDGQTPVEWAPAALKRRFSPDTYHLKPRTPNRDTAIYMDVVHTADQIGSDGDDAPATTPTQAPTPTTVDLDDTHAGLFEPADTTSTRSDTDVTDTDTAPSESTPEPITAQTDD